MTRLTYTPASPTHTFTEAGVTYSSGQHLDVAEKRAAQLLRAYPKRFAREHPAAPAPPVARTHPVAQPVHGTAHTAAPKAGSPK